MARFIVISASTAGSGHARLAAEALRKSAEIFGHTVSIKVAESGKAVGSLGTEDLRSADALIVAADSQMDLGSIADKPQVQVSTSKAIRESASVIQETLALLASKGISTASSTAVPIKQGNEKPFIVAVTSCPTGIAHTFLAANALIKAAEELGYRIKVETRG